MSAAEKYPLVGAEMNGYRITEGIGTGGFAHVYSAERNGAEYAVKVRDPIADMSSDGARQLFQQEIRTQSRLVHPNIVPIVDSGTYQDPTAVAFGRPSNTSYDYFVMPRAITSLEDAIPSGNRQAIPPSQLLNVVSDASAGLDYAHSQGTLHRDIKPSNILSLNKASGRAWALADFGIAVTAHSLESDATLTRQFLASSRMYTAPEQYEGNARIPSDVYSLGMVVSRICVDGSVYDIPAKVPSGAPYYRALRQARRRPFSELVPAMNGVLEELEPVIVRAVDKEPSKRQTSAGAFAAELAEAYHKARAKQTKSTVVVAGGDTKPYTDPNKPLSVRFHAGIASIPGGAGTTPETVKPPLSDTVKAPATTRKLAPDPTNTEPPHKTTSVHPDKPEAPRRYVPRKLVGSVLAATVAVGALIGSGKGAEVVDFATDDRAVLADAITESDPTDKAAFTAALSAYVDEEVEQARGMKYDTRPIRVMAGDTSLADDYVADRQSRKPVTNPGAAIDGMYIPHLIAAYAGQDAGPHAGQTEAEVASYAQANHWRGRRSLPNSNWTLLITKLHNQGYEPLPRCLRLTVDVSTAPLPGYL